MILYAEVGLASRLRLSERSPNPQAVRVSKGLIYCTLLGARRDSLRDASGAMLKRWRKAVVR